MLRHKIKPLIKLMHWEPYAHRGSVLLPSSRISTTKFLDMIIDDCKIRCLVGSTQFKTVDVLTISLRVWILILISLLALFNYILMRKKLQTNIIS